MTHTRTILAVLLAAVAMACTQNGGHIGRLFGSWVLESATCDGSEMTMPEDTETFWSFQSDLLRVQLADKHHTAENYFGNFTELPDGLLSTPTTTIPTEAASMPLRSGWVSPPQGYSHYVLSAATANAWS